MDVGGLLLLITVLAVITLYLSQTAARLDRLHHRIDTTRAVLQALFQDRASEVLALAGSGRFDPATCVLLADAADAALAQSRATGDTFGPARCAAESALTKALDLALADPDSVADLAAQPGGEQALAELAAATQKAAWTRRFYNDGVRSTLAVRRQRLVRLFKLAGTAPLPETVELDDEVPSALRSR